MDEQQTERAEDRPDNEQVTRQLPANNQRLVKAIIVIVCFHPLSASDGY